MTTTSATTTPTTTKLTTTLIIGSSGGANGRAVDSRSECSGSIPVIPLDLSAKVGDSRWAVGRVRFSLGAGIS